MPKKPTEAKAKPASKAKKAKPQPTKPQPTTKLSRAIALCQSKTGCTLDAIAAELKISRTAASSLLGDARAKGIKIERGISGRYCVTR